MVFGVISALVVILGFLAAAKGDEGLQLAGLVFIVFGLGGVFGAIHLHFKAYEQALKARPRPEAKAVKDEAAPAPVPAPVPAYDPTPQRASLPPSRPGSGRESMFTPVVRQWIKGGLVAIGGLLALGYAAASHGGSGQYIGIMLALVAIIWLFQMITRAIGGGSEGWALFPVPKTSTGMIIRSGQIIVVGLIALAVAAKTHDMGLQYAGLFVFGAAIFYIFRVIHEGIGNH